MIDIRKAYLDFFASKGHKIYDSMPLVPDDSSLLFTNAGMVQFKDIFTGKIPRPTPPRATSSQLCIRAGGKHNDLENVGYTARHHTLFEMLGNFSFGDYFKREAIAHAWEFVMEILEFPKDKIFISVHEKDSEAYALWRAFVADNHIKKMGDKDNFWQMGEVGPCGYCSEIYIDQGEAYFSGAEDYFGGEGDRFLEIWNLVFMQYERDINGNLTPLPRPSIDTGMGLERVIALKEGKLNNFDTSLFAPLMREIENISGLKYADFESSFRVIADHARSVAFLLAQNVNFDKEGRGYVLRRILRRAVRHGYLLGLRAPFLHNIVRVVCEEMGAHYTYLKERESTLCAQCEGEEARFFETIESGMELFSNELKNTRGAIFDGAIAFKLYDTYGFPLDLTQDMLREKGKSVDLSAFESCMQSQKSRSKASWKGSGDEVKNGDFGALLGEFGVNNFVGYEKNAANGVILALLDENFRRIEVLKKGAEGFVLLDSTPFYPESGGPVGDFGALFQNNEKIAEVLDTKKYFGLNISKARALRDLRAQECVESKVDSHARREIAKHHSATHLLHRALREILGTHITQAGSLVESARLRFDFSHPRAVSSDELSRIEAFVNDEISRAHNQTCEIMSLESAKNSGAMALFGEKYGESVRVISFGESHELCGGIHTPNTAHIGSFYIIKESGVSSGVRRIEAVCGESAYKYARGALDLLNEARIDLKTNDLKAAIAKLKARAKSTQNAATSAKSLDFEMINDAKLIVCEIENSGALKDLIDKAKNENARVAALLLAQNEGKIALAAGVKGVNLNASAWIKEVAKILGGNGGGREDFATAGGKNASEIHAALKKAREMAERAILGE